MAGREDSVSAADTSPVNTSNPLPQFASSEGLCGLTELEASTSVLDKEWGFVLHSPQRIGGLSSNNSNDLCSLGSKDWQNSLSEDSWFSEVSEMDAAMSEMLNPGSMDLWPSNKSTSNVASTSNPPQGVAEENPLGENPKETTNTDLILGHSSYNIHSSASASDGHEILPLECNEVETFFESTVNISEGNREVKSHHVPEIGMNFSSEDEAHKFYLKYAVEMGFKVRKGKVQWSANRSPTKRYFLCSKEGYRSKKQPTHMKMFTRKETRTGCKAFIQITFENGERCQISNFNLEHNHELEASTQRRHIDSSSKILEAAALNQPIHEIETTKEAEVGAYARPCEMNYSKHLSDKKMSSLQPQDAQGLIDHLKQLQVDDPSFFYTLQVDTESHMTNFFWRDSRSKIDYDYFGDVLFLDTTLKIDRYNMICALFWGVNHHRQPVLFGCAFLLDETMESFTWLLETFIGVMGKRQPKTIFTTECHVIAMAVEATLPKTKHRLCKQFVCQNAKQNLSMYRRRGFESHFHSWLFHCESEGEFESMWNFLLKKYNLHENSWLQNIYISRTKWSDLYSERTFCAGIDSIQGKAFLSWKSEAITLPEYVQKYEKIAEQQRREELYEDFCRRSGGELLILDNLMERQAENIYTRTMYKIFRKELMRTMSVPSELISSNGAILTFKVTEGKWTENIVEFNCSDSTTKCSCKMFESVGILCVHALKVLNTRNIFQIPPQHILKRWTKSAKDGVVQDDYGEESDKPLSLWKSRLMHKALNLITKSVAVENTREIAERYLDNGLKEVEAVLKKDRKYFTEELVELDRKRRRSPRYLMTVTYRDHEETSKMSRECKRRNKSHNG